MIPWYLVIFIASITLPLAVKWLWVFLVVPPRVGRQQHAPIEPGLESATAEHFTPELREMLHGILPQFQAEGFTVAAGVHHPNGTPGVRGLQTLLVNRATNDTATVIAVWAASQRSTVLAVRSEFADGRAVVTAVNRGPSIFPRDPNVDSENFPWVKDAHTLCELHRRRLYRLGKADLPRVAPAPGDEIEHLRREWRRECERHVRVGYRYADVAAGVYRYTLKGAYLTCWKLTPPIKTWRMRLRDRRARRLWRELGMDGWSPPRTVPPAVPAVAPAPAPPAAFAAPPAPQPSQLRYESTLAEGEIRQEATADGVTLRMGTPSVPRFLLRRWPTLLSIGLWSLLLSWNLLTLFRVQARFAGFVFRKELGWYAVSVLVMVGLLLNDVLRLLFAVLQLRGTVVITANHQGLTFRNAPALDHAGFIPRDNLDGLRVAIHKAGFRRHLHFLYASLEGGKRQTLLVGADPAALEAARVALVGALGIEAHHPEYRMAPA